MYTGLKRLMDLTAGIFVLILFSWLFILIALIYFLSQEFPMLYVQDRIGKDEIPFRMFKFRSLSTDTSKPLIYRTFWLGNFLRVTNLDELPQCWNILKGEMSFVGPRPLPIDYLPSFKNEERRRHSVRPGVTGWAQVNGKNDINWKKKFELDLYYVKHISFYLDMKVLFKTVILIVSFKRDTSLFEEKFTG